MSDTGAHFRSYLVLGSLASNLLQEWKPTIMTIRVFYGCEGHYKNPVDGFFSQLREALRVAAQASDVETADDLVACYKAYWAEHTRADPSKCPCRVFLWQPSQDRHLVKLSHIKAASLPALLKGCHRWTLHVHDNRRVGLTKYEGVLTGVDVVCHGIRGSTVRRFGCTRAAVVADATGDQLIHACTDDPESRNKCKACLAGLPQAADAQEENDSKTLEELGLAVKLWRGWKVSCMTKMPHKETVEECEKRIDWKRRHCTYAPLHTEVSRTKSADQRRLASDAIAEIKKQRRARVTALGLPAL